MKEKWKATSQAAISRSRTLFRSGGVGTGNGILIALLVLFIAGFCILRPALFSAGTLQSVCLQFPEIGILTLGMGITMLIGGINLSCIASANLSAIVMISILTRWLPKEGNGLSVVAAAAAAGIFVSVAVGILNGILIAVFHVPDILATLSTQMLFGGLNLLLTKGGVLTASSPIFSALGSGTLLGVPVSVILFIFCMAIGYLVLCHTGHGREMYIYGSNRVVSRFHGTSPVLLTVRTYALSGFFVGIAAVIMTSRFSSASAAYASSYLMQTVLIAVLGGISPDGGRGRISGLILAVLLIQVISTGFNGFRLDSHLSIAILGIILLVSTWFIGRKKEE